VNANPSVQSEVVVGRFRLASSTLALWLGGFSLLALAASGVLTILAHDLRASFDGIFFVIITVVGAVGLVVARRQPSNPIGWLLLTASGLFALNGVAALYTVLDYREHAGRLPLGRLGLGSRAMSTGW
jgi:hypothetical protein